MRPEINRKFQIKDFEGRQQYSVPTSIHNKSILQPSSKFVHWRNTGIFKKTILCMKNATVVFYRCQHLEKCYPVPQGASMDSHVPSGLSLTHIGPSPYCCDSSRSFLWMTHWLIELTTAPDSVVVIDSVKK